MRVPMTRIKLLGASWIYKALKVFISSDLKLVRRGGIRYFLDLSEGIDLSVYLFGNFQRHVTRPSGFSIPSDAVIFDVGANIGVTTLNYAKAAVNGRVYAFEPTHYAFSKLLRNIGLNSGLAANIVPIQCFVSSGASEPDEMVAYSSWKIDGKPHGRRHRIHGGIAQDTGSVPSISLDAFCEKEKINRVDFIKIDTEGYEHQVLLGGRKSIAAFHPVIIFEAGLYQVEDRCGGFKDYLDFFDSLGYSLYNSKNMAPINRENYRKNIPQYATIDVLAVPKPAA